MLILAIDDNEHMLESYKRTFLRAGHEVLACVNGKIALEFLSAGTDPDYIICDYQMPVMDGIGVFTWIKANRPELLPKFMMNTGLPNECQQRVGEDVVVCYKLPANEILEYYIEYTEPESGS